MARVDRRLTEFKEYLKSQGIFLQPIHKPEELIRFSDQHGVSILYTANANAKRMTGRMHYAWTCFCQNRQRMQGYRKAVPSKVQLLLERDGDECFLCCQKLGDDITVDHLVAKSKGGPDHLDNYVLMHRRCNNLCEDRSPMWKMRMRERNRDRIQKQECALLN